MTAPTLNLAANNEAAEIVNMCSRNFGNRYVSYTSDAACLDTNRPIRSVTRGRGRFVLRADVEAFAARRKPS